MQQGAGVRATVAKVPSDAGEALRSSLMGIFEKRRMKGFIEWIGTFNEADTASHKGETNDLLEGFLADSNRIEHQHMHDEGRL